MKIIIIIIIIVITNTILIIIIIIIIIISFWSRGITAFFDVRVTHVNSKCNQGKATSTIFKEQQEEKSGSTNRECWTLKWDLSLS